jgi:hypothetical protein
MNIKEKFLQLTKKTYPHGSEQEVFGLLGIEMNKDEHGNLFLELGDSDTMFTSHLDTATSANTPVNHVFEGNIIKTDGTSILGADDKAGVVIMLYMIQNSVPGLYYFFLGEEVGCVGSRKVAATHTMNKLDKIKKVVSFDRRGTTSVISHQGGSRSASDKFTDALAKELNDADHTFSYKTDPTGIYTDSVQFVRLYPECTNISVGYKNEHSFSELQDIEHLEKLAKAVVKIDWANLPVDRDPSKTEYDYYGYGSSYSSKFDYDNDHDYAYGVGAYGGNSYYKKEAIVDKAWFRDYKFSYLSYFNVNSKTKLIESVDLHEDRVSYERQMIIDLLLSLELEYTDLTWDGMKLVIYYDDKNSTEVDRNDIIAEFLPEFDYANVKDLIEEGKAELEFSYWD